MKAMLLAAGRGNRLNKLTHHTPKPLLKVGERALIEHHLVALAQAGITDVVINISYLAKQFISQLGDGSRYGVAIHYSFEPEEGGLETGGGIYQALPLLGNDPFIAISADLYTDYPLQHLPRQLDGLAHLVLVDNPPHHPDGDFCLVDGLIQETGAPLVNFGGIGVYSPSLFQGDLPRFFPLTQVLRPAIRTKQVSGEHYQGVWHNITTAEQLEILQAAAN